MALIDTGSEVEWPDHNTLACWNTLLPSMQTRPIRSVLLWCLPTLLMAAITLALMETHFYASLPFHRRLHFDQVWMIVATILPIPTVVAAVRAFSLRFGVAEERSVWRPIVGWVAVVAAAGLNVLFYRVIVDTLR